MSRVLLVVLWFAALPACRRENRAEIEARAELARTAELARSRQLGDRLTLEIASARAHLEQVLAPDGSPARVRCVDDAIVRGSAADSTLVVRVRDARSERRELLPLGFSAALESDDFVNVVSHLAFGRAALWDAGKSGAKTEADAEAALAALAELRARRYRAELWVDAFSPPRVFRRKDEPRSEWAAGSLSARLVIADLREQRVLCQSPLAVRGDAADASISRRLREVTRERLLRDLNERVWTEMGRALASVSAELRLPRTETRSSAAHRWAAAPELGSTLASADPLTD